MCRDVIYSCFDISFQKMEMLKSLTETWHTSPPGTLCATLLPIPMMQKLVQQTPIASKVT